MRSRTRRSRRLLSRAETLSISETLHWEWLDLAEGTDIMIGTEFIKGYGLGNQLFFYVVTRCMAEEKGVDFGFINPGQVGNVFHSNKGMYFMDIDLGTEIPPEE